MIPEPHRDWLARSLLNGQSVEDVERKLARDPTARLWTTPTAVCVTHVKRVLEFYAAGGELGSILDAFPAVEAHARDLGCDALLIAGRPGWKRALKGFDGPVSFLVKEL